MSSVALQSACSDGCAASVLLAYGSLDLLQLRLHLFGEADEGLLIVRGGEAGNKVLVAELHVWGELLDDLVNSTTGWRSQSGEMPFRPNWSA